MLLHKIEQGRPRPSPPLSPHLHHRKQESERKGLLFSNPLVFTDPLPSEWATRILHSRAVAAEITNAQLRKIDITWDSSFIKVAFIVVKTSTTLRFQDIRAATIPP